MKQIEIESIDDYLSEAERLADLHLQLRSCDSVLEKMEQMLFTFQNSLGDTAEEIKKLKDQSFTMSIKLNNRKSATALLSEFLQKIVVHPKLISDINNMQVNEKYLSPILELDSLLGNFETVDKKIPIYEELEPQLNSLMKTAVNKLRVFMEGKVKDLVNKKSRDSNQIGIQYRLLKYKYFYDFLEKHSPQNAVVIRKHYINVLGNHYLNSFKNYISSLQKRFPKAFAAESANSNTIVEISNFSLSSLTNLNNLTSFSMSNLFTNAEKTSKTEKFFDLGDRFEKINNNVLISFEMPTHQAEQVDFTELWTSTFVLLTNTITSEYAFLLDFFGNQSNGANPQQSVLKEIFSQMFASSFELLMTFTENYTSQTWDSVGVLLLIRKINDLKETMRKRDIKDESLSQFWTALENKLWERFRIIFEKNVASINQLAENDYKSLSQNKNLISREKTNFIISKKFAQWITSIYRLGVARKIEKDIINLCKTYSGIIEHMGKCSKNPKFGKFDHILIVNCVDQILSLFTAYGIGEEITRIFADLLKANINQLIDDLLQVPNVNMSKLIAFLSQAENLVSSDKSRESNRQALSVDITLAGVKKSAYVHLEMLINEFNNQWKNSLTTIYSNIVSQFPNLGIRKTVMERAIVVWLQHYKRFSRIVEAVFGKNSSQLIAEQKVHDQLRKYNAEFLENN